MGQVKVVALARRRIRVGLIVLLTAVAISLATFSLVVAALSWVEFRNLSRSLQGWADHGQQGGKSSALETVRPNPPARLGFLQALLSSKAVLRKRRGSNRGSGSKNKATVAAHFEVTPGTENGIYVVDQGGVIKNWAERSIQVKHRALNYNSTTGEFLVVKDGIYYVYSQVHCDDNSTAYLKLDVKVDNVVAFKCLQGLPPTPVFGQQLPVHSCQASGLVRLSRNSRITISSIAGVRLKARTFTYFGLFRL
ncbi:tumor necrosis factor ligand superfamily member 12 [Hypanus sabinus]|uniref:tumor necrosis factor ligand superfamily member 12 n=1 Tax=Hypanus sabinus TaxID=79690 RepID=UPI0028C4337E|nr:tumor necrosis factor ligand superfamily member 12 [Hypanus sabinus]XP_059831157.1 tumor necrosis factor ligand superfamily member 12 [Hypanus sabinus]XP_059831158.1 tumor necrosis factor ligand superfamily member 12 [Hypanus sabinus]XP_059831159.1 tumor necrosis factor ligand superfamily member 12 [Hypanus sabinus]